MSTLGGMHIWHDPVRDQIIARVGVPGITRVMALEKGTVQAFLHSACRLIEQQHDTPESGQIDSRDANVNDDVQCGSGPAFQVVENAAALKSSAPWSCMSPQHAEPELIGAIDIDTDGTDTVVAFLARQASFGRPPLCRVTVDICALHRLVMMMALSSAYGGWNLIVPIWLYQATVARSHSDAALGRARISSIGDTGLRRL